MARPGPEDHLNVAIVGRSMGEHLVETTPDWDSMDHVSMERWWQGVIGDRYWFWVAEVADKHPRHAN